MYFKKEEISSLKKMGELVCDLFKGMQFNLFIEDPKAIDRNIKRKLRTPKIK